MISQEQTLQMQALIQEIEESLPHLRDFDNEFSTTLAAQAAVDLVAVKRVFKAHENLERAGRVMESLVASAKAKGISLEGDPWANMTLSIITRATQIIEGTK